MMWQGQYGFFFIGCILSTPFDRFSLTDPCDIRAQLVIVNNKSLVYHIENELPVEFLHQNNKRQKTIAGLLCCNLKRPTIVMSFPSFLFSSLSASNQPLAASRDEKEFIKTLRLANVDIESFRPLFIVRT